MIAVSRYHVSAVSLLETDETCMFPTFPTFALSELPNFPPSAMPTVAARPLARAEAQSCQDKPTKGTGTT